jgi:hypothetical protein
MTKTFCDFCGKEVKFSKISASKSGKTTIAKLKVNIEVSTKFVSANSDEDWPAQGDICHYCVIDALAELDDRPKEGPA